MAPFNAERTLWPIVCLAVRKAMPPTGIIEMNANIDC